MSSSRRSSWGQRTAGLTLALAVAIAGCSDASDDDGNASGAEISTQDGGVSTSVDGSDGAGSGSEATTGSDGTGLTLPGADTTVDGGSGGTGDGSDGEGGDDPTSTAAPAQPWDQTDFVLQPVASLAEPTTLRARPGSGDLWVTERAGRVRIIERNLDTQRGTETLTQSTNIVLDLTGKVDPSGEGGLLGMAFSADGSKLYLSYTDLAFDSVVSEFAIGATTADPATERELLRIEQPFSNHNGGDIHFGPDGRLYLGLGDGGSADDPLLAGQDTDTLLGAMLRIDPTPSGAAAFTVPADNPFASGGGAPEIWAWGLRNPWRFSFDAETGDLWIGDVGQNRVEEIDFLPSNGGAPGGGANLGWNLMEGNDRFAGDPPPGHVGPIHSYAHDGGRCSVTGGFVYRGAFAPGLDGVYLYSDVCVGEIVGIERGADGSARVANLLTDRIPDNVISFGQGPDGELYVLEQGGRISRIQPSGLPLETTLSSS